MSPSSFCLPFLHTVRRQLIVIAAAFLLPCCPPAVSAQRFPDLLFQVATEGRADVQTLSEGALPKGFVLAADPIWTGTVFVIVGHVRCDEHAKLLGYELDPQTMKVLAYDQNTAPPARSAALVAIDDGDLIVWSGLRHSNDVSCRDPAPATEEEYDSAKAKERSVVMNEVLRYHREEKRWETRPVSQVLSAPAEYQSFGGLRGMRKAGRHFLLWQKSERNYPATPEGTFRIDRVTWKGMPLQSVETTHIQMDSAPEIWAPPYSILFFPMRTMSSRQQRDAVLEQAEIERTDKQMNDTFGVHDSPEVFPASENELKDRIDAHSGLIYDAAADHWRTISPVGAPSRRLQPTVKWAGGRLVVWGGFLPLTEDASQNDQHGGPISSGAMYDIATDSWTPIILPDEQKLGVPIDGGALASTVGDEIVFYYHPPSQIDGVPLPQSNQENLENYPLALFSPKENKWRVLKRSGLGPVSEFRKLDSQYLALIAEDLSDNVRLAWYDPIHEKVVRIKMDSEDGQVPTQIVVGTKHVLFW